MGFNQGTIVSVEWEVVVEVARMIKKSPHWIASFKGNVTEDGHIIYWDLCDVGLTKLPDNFGNLSELKRLNLGRNNILELFTPTFAL